MFLISSPLKCHSMHVMCTHTQGERVNLDDEEDEEMVLLALTRMAAASLQLTGSNAELHQSCNICSQLMLLPLNRKCDDGGSVGCVRWARLHSGQSGRQTACCWLLCAMTVTVGVMNATHFIELLAN